MNIRAVVQFIPLTWPLDEGTIAASARFLHDARQRLSEAGFNVQSIGLATPPFLDVLQDPTPQLLLDFAQALDTLAEKYNIDKVSIGPLVATTPLALLMPIHTLPQLIAQTQRIYSGVLLADAYSGINLSAAFDFAQTVKEIANTSPNGLGNRRLAALANVLPQTPFFPAAYQQGIQPEFAIAAEATDFALNAISNTQTATQAHKLLVNAIESSVNDILKTVDELVDSHQIQFGGIDFSFTPDQEQTQSIALAIEKLGVGTFGGNGTLFALSFLTNTIRQADIPHTGLSAITLPLLQDSSLAQRVDAGQLSVNDLMLYSAVAGAGLDLLPVPGNTSAEEIAAIYLDVAALAVFSGQPLAARLLPIPGKSAGEKVAFDDASLVDASILAVKNTESAGLFQKNSFLSLNPQSKQKRTKSQFLSSFKFKKRP